MKRGQLQHVFIYIFALLIIGALILVGYKAIGKLTEAGCETSKESFKADLLSMIDRYNAKGNFHAEELAAPCGFQQLCFIDSDVVLGDAGFGGGIDQYPILKDAASSRARTNIFLNKGATWESAGFSEKIELGPDEDAEINQLNFACIKTKAGKFKIEFEGLGRRTRVYNYAGLTGEVS